MLSWRNDRHHGQWLVLHVPFRRITELVDPEVDAKVPRPHRFLAHALRCPHPVARAFWQDEAKAAEEMKREGRQRKYIEDVLQNCLGLLPKSPNLQNLQSICPGQGILMHVF